MPTIYPHIPPQRDDPDTLSPLSSPPSTPTPAYRPRPPPRRNETPLPPSSPPAPRELPPSPAQNPIHEPSDTSFVPSSPIRGRGAEKRKNVAAKAARKRVQARAAKATNEEERKEKVYEEVLKTLKREKCNVGDFLVFVSDPKKYQGQSRYHGIFRRPQIVATILEYWVSAGNRSLQGRHLVKAFMVKQVGRMIFNEGESVKKSGFLQTAKKVIGPSFALDFSMNRLHEQLSTHCPTFMSLLERFSTSASQQRRGMSEKSRRRKDRVLTTSALLCLGERSQRNNLMKLILTFYTYAEGARRQVISVLAHLGLTTSYSSLLGSRRTQNSTSSARPTDEGLSQADQEHASATSSSEDEDDSASDSECEFDEEDTLEVRSRQKDLGAEEVDGGDSNGGMGCSGTADEDWTDIDESDAGEAVLKDAGLLEEVEEGPSSGRESARSKERPAQGEEQPAQSGEGPAQRGDDEGTESGYLKRLSTACRYAARQAAASNLLAVVYDNINTVFRAAEQILGRKDSQENGTCATAFALFNASADDMKTSDLLESFLTAPPLSCGDFVLTSEEERTLTTRLEHTILRILVAYGGEHFAQYQDDVEATTPVTLDKITVHKTEVFPLPAMPIDESSITGNAEVVTEIFRELGKPFDAPHFAETVKILAGDQLSIARLRSLLSNRVGHDELAHTFLWAVFMPGLFHYKMAFTHGFMETHYGKTNTVRNPGSLAFHNTVLDRIPIVLSSLPPFRTSRDLIFVSLYARVFHCLLLISDTSSLTEFAAKSVSFRQLKTYARQIVVKFASPTVARGLRREREREKMKHLSLASGNWKPTKGDEVFENAVYYLRDALTLRELNDAIKVGDSGRVVDVLKQWALMYRGMGRTKYAYEMMHLVHNLKYVWPEPLRKIVLQNWLVNPTGQKNAWVEVDLMQEHLNFWIKTIYQAHGSAASWEWLAMVAPCIDVLRRLAQRIHNELGSHQGIKHSAPDLQRDIARLMDSLDEHRVYSVEDGRIIDEPGCLVPNAVAEGLKQLDEPLKDYNRSFSRLQARTMRTPLVGGHYAPELVARRAQEAQDDPLLHKETQSDQGSDKESSASSDEASSASDEDTDIWSRDTQMFSLETAGDVALDMDTEEA